MTLATQIRATARELLKLSELAASAELAQWERSHTPTARDDTTERAKGGHGDPTSDTALDPRRLALRESYRHAEAILLGAEMAARASHANLARDLAAWHGESRLALDA